MPKKTHPFTSNFSRGEWSPKLEGRIDLKGYPNSAHEITDWIITTAGTLITRGGWHFVAEVKDSTKEARLIPFQYSERQNYIIEIGDEYMRYFMNCGQIESGGLPYEIVSPYYEDEIWEIRYAQDDEDLYLVHPDVQRQLVTRLDHTIWSIEELESLDGPYMDEVTDVKITPSGTTGNITLVATPVLGSDNLVVDGTFSAPALSFAVSAWSASNQSGGAASNCGDGNAATAWFPYQLPAASPWIAMDLGVARNITSIKVDASAYGANGVRLKDFEFRYSDDNITWFLSDNFQHTNVDGEETFVLGTPSTHRYWGIVVTSYWATDGSYVRINEITFVDPTPTIWTYGTGWTYDGGADEADHNSDGTASLSQTIAGITPTYDYKVTFTLKNKTAGTVTPKIGGTLGTPRDANGTYIEYITATTTGGLEFVPSNNFRGSIDDVSVYLVTSGTGIFLDDHIGSVFRIKHTTTWGRVQITAVADGLHASGTVLTTLGGVGASDGWMESCWSDVNGYPRVLNFHEGRIQYASTYEQPQTIWASKTYDLNVFTPGTDDDSPYSLTPAAQRIIRWLKTTRRLCVGSMSGEATAIGPNDAAISATDPPKINDETTHGSASLDAVKINKAILFLQQSETKIREFSYKYEDDAYSATDITVLAEHLFGEGIIDMAYQQEPYSILWVVTSDGILHGCTYNRETNAIGWFNVETDGDVESVAVIPYLGKDQLWAIIRRTINGIQKRYVEYMDWDISLDSALTYSGVPITTVSGLDHLIGKTVRAIGDGAYAGEHTVSPAGSIVLADPASEIVVGLPFIPTLVTSRPEISLPNGSSQGLFKGWAKIILRLIDTIGITVNGEIWPAHLTNDIMGGPPIPYSGDVSFEATGWDADGRITIVQPLPFSAHIVALFGDLIIGDS